MTENRWVKLVYSIFLLVCSPVVLPLSLLWVYRDEVAEYYVRAYNMLVRSIKGV